MRWLLGYSWGESRIRSCREQADDLLPPSSVAFRHLQRRHPSLLNVIRDILERPVPTQFEQERDRLREVLVGGEVEEGEPFWGVDVEVGRVRLQVGAQSCGVRKEGERQWSVQKTRRKAQCQSTGLSRCAGSQGERVGDARCPVLFLCSVQP